MIRLRKNWFTSENAKEIREWEDIGLAYMMIAPTSLDLLIEGGSLYMIIDKELFFLSVIKYGIVFEEVS